MIKIVRILHEVEWTIFVLGGLHVTEHNAVAVQQVLERLQTQIVEICVQAAIFHEIHVAQRIQTVDRLGKLTEHVLEPGELVAH